jgi:predicted NBD/HSP70 family sugar kinase
VTFVDVFDPDLIVVGGSIARGQGDRLLGPARDLVAREAFRAPAARVRIVPAALGDDVGLVGGLVLVHTRTGDDRWRDGRPPLARATGRTAPEASAVGT